MTIRNDAERDGMAAVGRLVGEALRTMAAAVAPGVTTAALDDIGAAFLRGQGAESAPQAIYNFPGFSCISVNDEVVHGVPGPRRLADGDLVKLDVTARLDGYIADAAVTVPVGAVAADHKALCDAARRGVRPRPAATCGRAERVSDVGRVIDAEVRGRGFAVVREVAGHGVGRTIHEPPDVLNYFNPHQRDRFEDGQVVAIEPIITMSQTRLVEDADGWTLRTKNGVFAAHYEHTVLVTAARRRAAHGVVADLLRIARAQAVRRRRS